MQFIYDIKNIKTMIDVEDLKDEEDVQSKVKPAAEEGENKPEFPYKEQLQQLVYLHHHL